MAQRKYKRKKYLVLIRFQLKYIAYILLFLYIGAAVAGYTVYWTTWVTLGEKLANVYPRGRLYYIFQAANLTLLLRLLLMTPIFIVLGIFLSHRIAGPIYRLQNYINSLIAGDYAYGVTLRKNDELKGVAAKLSELCTALREKKANRDKAVDEVIKTLEQKKTDPDTLKDIKSTLKDV